MPLTTPRASANCCTARDPPSPDGLAPRLAVASSSKDTSEDVSIEHGRSWTSADVNELQAIFEDEMLADIHTNAIKLNRIHIDDDDGLVEADTESEADRDQLKHKKSSHTLRAVTKKLRKHLSIDSALSKRHSRSSIGVTDEEVERRAELRRIRQRRITEELSHESIYDDDAKSLSSLLGVGSDGEKRLTTQSSTIVTPLVELEAQEVHYQPPILPQMAPTTADEGSPAVTSPKTISNFIDTSTSPTLVDSDGSICQDQEAHRHMTTEYDELDPKAYVPTSAASLILQTPASELLNAKRLPSVAEPEGFSKSLWRSSFSSDHRREGLRKLSQGSGMPDAAETEISAAAATSSNKPDFNMLNPVKHEASLKFAKGNALGIAGSHLQNCSGSMDFGGVDGSTDEITRPQLQETKISRGLASSRLQSSISSPQLSSWGSRQQGQPSSANTNTADHTRRKRHTDHLGASIDASLNVWNVIKSDKSPCRPKSAAPDSRRLSAVDSRFSFFSYKPCSKSRAKSKVSSAADEEDVKDPLESEQENGEHGITTALPGLTNIIPASPGVDIENPEPIITASLSPALLAQIDASLGPSEASSFQEREQELETLQLRFAERRVLSTPVSSKFREEFDKPARPARKASVLVRLARLARRSIEGTGDGTVDRTDLLSVPIPEFDPTSLLKTPGSPMLDDAEVFWGNAVKSSKGKEIEKDGKKGVFGRKKSVAGGKKKGMGFFGKKKKDELSAAEQYRKQYDERMAVKELVMDSWEMEMEATAAKAKTKSKNIVKNIKTTPDYRFPASWARFSSHDREERVSSATSVEKVDVKDFANLGLQENGNVLWCLAHDDEGHHTTIDGLHRKKPLGERIVLAVERELYECDTQDDQRAQTNGRRGSLTVALETEYPELEILPLKMMGDEELKKQEDKKKQFETAVAKEAELDEIAKLLGGAFDGVMSGERVMRKALSSTGVSDWEDEMVMSVASGEASRLYGGVSDPEYYADCVVVTKSTFASTVGSRVGTPGGTLVLRTDILDELLRMPAGEGGEVGEFDYERWKGNVRGKERSRVSQSGEEASWEGYGSGNGTVGSGGERKRSLGTMLLSKSVSDGEMMGEMEMREKEGREGLLRAVEDAFGKGE